MRSLLHLVGYLALLICGLLRIISSGAGGIQRLVSLRGLVGEGTLLLGKSGACSAGEAEGCDGLPGVAEGWLAFAAWLSADVAVARCCCAARGVAGGRVALRGIRFIHRLFRGLAACG